MSETSKQTTTHVEANVEMSRDAGSIPAASIETGLNIDFKSVFFVSKF